MRTKTLLLTAAVSAAGVATSMAQVYSVNAVGYVNKEVPAGKLALIANPLDAGAGNNTIANLFKGAPDGTQVFYYTGTGYVTATYDGLDGAFTPASAANQEIKVGEGVFVKAPPTGSVKVTFVGEVLQGTLNNPLPAGLSIKASMVPQAGTAAALGLVGGDGDQVNQFDVATGSYYTSTFDGLENAWAPPLKDLAVGEAFFLRKVTAGTWTRTFSVNP